MNARLDPPAKRAARTKSTKGRSAGASRRPAPARVAKKPDATRVLLLTGLSGAGKSSALKALEDLGYEAVDNLPLSLLAALISPGRAFARPLAIGVDIRTRDFGVGPFIQELDELMANPEVDVSLLFLDCDDEVLRRRFTETRRRHPLADDRPVTDGIRLERTRLSRLRERANAVIDTTDFKPADLRRTLEENYSPARRPRLAIYVTSFAYGLGLPRDADLVVDVRFLQNPHYDPALRPLTGRDAAVGAFIRRDAGFQAFLDNLKRLLKPLLPRYEQEGKSYLTIAVGCTGGRHRSVYVAEQLGDWLAGQGQRVRVLHRDVGRDTGIAVRER
ncbi:MAG: RNase adapter RapZ [Candidatus Eiseniibacteriota bacterium]